MSKNSKKVWRKSRKITYEQNENINKEIENLKRNKNQILESLELKRIVIEMKNSLSDSKANLSRQRKDSANLKIGQLKLLSLRNRKKHY